jgi:hypothetical protein
MANTIRIKRRASGGAGAPTSLQNAEVAYNEVSDVLYYGKGTGGAGGSATTIEAIGGKGAYVDLSSNQTIGGSKTFSSPITGSVSGNAGTATKLATARSISATGDASWTVNFDGSGNVTAALTLATVNSNVGAFTKFTVNGKGLITAASQASLSDLAAATADYSFGGYKITNLADPVNAGDAANKGYVDAVAQGLDVKPSVLVATTANITLSGFQAVDGVNIFTGDRVLVKNQTNPAQNGIYVANDSGAWTRAADMNAWAEFPGAFTFVESGGVNPNTSWVCDVEAGGTLGTDPVTFAQFGSAGSYSAGDGLDLSGSVFSVLADGTSLSVSGAGVKISDSYAGQTSITTLGTIATGTWQGTAIAVGYGGLGLTSAITGLLKGNGTAYSAATAGTDYLDPNSTIDGGTF